MQGCEQMQAWGLARSHACSHKRGLEAGSLTTSFQHGTTRIPPSRLLQRCTCRGGGLEYILLIVIFTFNVYLLRHRYVGPHLLFLPWALPVSKAGLLLGSLCFNYTKYVRFFKALSFSNISSAAPAVLSSVCLRVPWGFRSTL